MRNFSVALILVIFAILVGCATKFEPANPEAFGIRWELLGVTTDRNQVFYDPHSITYSGSITKFKYRCALAVGDEHIGWVEIDCERDRVRTFDVDKYYKYYRSVDRIRDTPWQRVRFNSVLNLNRSRFCK